ncbi:hypothetical protein Y032_0252g227 [Ancylostoma ceylanicum]|uniref:Uncharacterized protein n=1 Tax=Ancylostoma ceylanicum TaxID=53326 RepID=A0A016SCM0_9BILA|nr:hypothetical protein Y032_0252g227 [Ancylostoma ceylanicum]
MAAEDMRIRTPGHSDDDELDLEYEPHKTMFEMCEENAAKVALLEQDVREMRKTLDETKAALDALRSLQRAAQEERREAPPAAPSPAGPMRQNPEESHPAAPQEENLKPVDVIDEQELAALEKAETKFCPGLAFNSGPPSEASVAMTVEEGDRKPVDKPRRKSALKKSSKDGVDDTKEKTVDFTRDEMESVSTPKSRSGRSQPKSRSNRDPRTKKHRKLSDVDHDYQHHFA